MALTAEQQQEIEAARAAEAPTRRPTALGVEALLFQALPVLDHGFVRVVDYMGDDAAVVQAARVSYGRGTRAANEDRGLIRYLMRHRHTTPFEMCEIKYHVKLPIFVARQWIRHRTANVNEYSARYSIMDREFYIPEPQHLAAQSTVNNQGRGAVLEGAEAARVLEILKSDAARSYDHYEAMLSQDGQQGLARELARMNLPANIYTQWYWKMDLHNLFHMLMLRMDSHSQWEIQQYAQAIWLHVQQWVPVSAKAFEVYRVNSSTFSQRELSALALLVDNDESRSMMDALHKMDVETIAEQSQGEFSQGEWKEFLVKLDKLATKLVK